MVLPHPRREPIAALNRIKLIENHEPLIDLRKFFPELPILRETAVPWLRETAAQMLRNANKLLEPNYRLGLREAWRSLQRQKLLYDRFFEQMREKHPHASYATLRRLTNRFFAPYDQKAPPGHCTGGAVDVWLLNANGEPIDLYGGDRFLYAPTFAKNVPKEVQRNRLILYEAMIEAGFSNCADEWWHYSYGDAAWAVRTGRTECVYGLITLPEEEYIEADRLFVEELAKRT
ncbi:MAG TPA: M15 family metallopeptidase [Fimbriimonadales bacterium]|nr:M15 family metallopeptidase [Fimbriimonadales bacterium]